MMFPDELSIDLFLMEKRPTQKKFGSRLSKPRSAFFHFMLKFREDLRSQGFVINDLKEICHAAGAEWSNMDDQQRLPYTEMARAEKLNSQQDKEHVVSDCQMKPLASGTDKIGEASETIAPEKNDIKDHKSIVAKTNPANVTPEKNDMKDPKSTVVPKTDPASVAPEKNDMDVKVENPKSVAKPQPPLRRSKMIIPPNEFGIEQLVKKNANEENQILDDNNTKVRKTVITEVLGQLATSLQNTNVSGDEICKDKSKTERKMRKDRLRKLREEIQEFKKVMEID